MKTDQPLLKFIKTPLLAMCQTKSHEILGHDLLSFLNHALWYSAENLPDSQVFGLDYWNWIDTNHDHFPSIQNWSISRWTFLPQSAAHFREVAVRKRYIMWLTSANFSIHFDTDSDFLESGRSSDSISDGETGSVLEVKIGQINIMQQLRFDSMIADLT
jgi:hypothetical protein